jgi:hypothetical protein
MGPSAGEDLQALIKVWAGESPEARNVRYLERRSGLDYNTVSRIWSGKNPECQTALAILNAVATKEEGLLYLRKHFPHAAKFHERELTTTPVFSDAEALRPVLDNVLSFLIMNFAYAKVARREYIAKHYGMMGLDLAEKLVRSGRLRWSGDDLLPSGEEEFFTYESKDDLVRACQHIVSLSASDKGHPVAVIGSLSDDEHERLKGIIREFCSAAKELIYSSKGGSNAVALATVYVNLLSEGGLQ